MRKLFIIIIPLLPFVVKAQLLNTVDQIATYNNPYSQLVFVKDSLRGGQFLPYTGTDTADNGIIFQDALNRKWKRQLSSGNAVSLLWYGLSDTASISSSKNYNAFMGAYNYVTTHRLSSDIIAPAGTYKFNQTITIDTSVSIRGVGNFYDWKTIFVFPENTTGFRLKTKEDGLLNTVVNMSDIEVRGYANYNNPGTLTLDSTKHAFDISCIVHFNEVHVYGYAGNGFNIDACATPGASNYGNSDNSYFTYCGADVCNNGIYLNGCDANIITIHNSSFTLNRRFNIRDNGFLGNNYQKNHLAYGGVYKTFCTALYNGVHYVAINADTLLNINKRPDLNPDYWAVIDFVPETVNTWDNSTRYWQGGSILIENVNNYSVSIGDYIEASQPPVRSRGRSLTIGGDNGSGTAEGANIHANAGWVYIKNAGLVTEDFNTTGTVTHSGYNGIPVINASGTMSTINGTASQVLRRNAANDGYEFATIAAGGISQATLDDSTAALRTTIDGKQSNISLTTTGVGGVATLVGATLNIPNYAGGGGLSRVFLPSDVINNNASANTIADVTGLSFPVNANTTYSFKFFIVYSSAATTTGSRWSINGPATVFISYTSQYTLTATSITNNAGLAAYNSPSGASASSLATGNIAIIQGTIRPSANGTVIARFASEISNSAITAIASGRSYVEYQIIN